MIKSIKFLRENTEVNLKFVKIHEHKVEIDSSFLGAISATIQIEFEIPIIEFRNHDYTWKPIEQKQFANWYAPKILKLKNNQLVQANQHTGIWEFDEKNLNILLWHFNAKNGRPIVQYDSNNSKQIIQSVSNCDFINSLALLFPVSEGVEISRSKSPFSAIACFTDHCDFDTLSNLKLQRQFFKTYNIKITKGFFLNHFSKRPDTACYETHDEELKKWDQDGHELAYHSLSQSIKPLDESMSDFETFISPFKEVSTWIDHGFQPYNLSCYQNYERIRTNYGSSLKQKGIDVFWNYIDSGTVVNGVINQLNPNQFTLHAHSKGIQHLKLKARMPMFIKNIIFHYYGTDYSLRLYRDVANYFKTLKQKKSIKKHVKVLIAIFKLARLLIPVLLFWKTRKNKVYPLARYNPVVFNQDISKDTFTVFQTIEMVDFKSGLSQTNLDLLIKERGLFIAHTYFSAPLDYHHGKFFENKNEIDKQVEMNFSYLSQKISSKDIWNPTLKELITHLNNFHLVSFDCNEIGELLVIDKNQLTFRKIR
jgi:hypothetical protein